MTKRSNAKDWCARPVETWNTVSFTEYLRDRHTELYGIPYVPGRGGWRAEQGMIKRMIDEHGPEVVRRFIDGCFREYRPTRDYPGVNFTFMYTYMRSRVLSRVLAERAREMTPIVAAPNNGMTLEELSEWL